MSVGRCVDQPGGEHPLLVASSPVLFLDYFKIPYEISDGDDAASPLPARHPLRSWAWLRGRGPRAGGRRPVWYWPAEADHPSDATDGTAAQYRLDGIPLFGRVVPDRVIREHLAGTSAGWEPSAPVRDAAGNTVSAVWATPDGDLLVPFDPAETIRNYWSEGYRSFDGSAAGRAAKRSAARVYYRVRPLLPRSAQIRARRLYSRVQSRTSFPRWPVEPALHELYDWLFARTVDVAGSPVPWIAPWPDGFSWSLVLTHDVETAEGYSSVGLMRSIERRAGFRSCWNFVPRRYEVDQTMVEELVGDGFEVGVHGAYHDGRDLESLTTLRRRLPAIRHYADRWEARGFRSPATQRNWQWMPQLGFDYDSSYPDTDPFEPQAGGCCSWLPFFNEQMVELPITMTQDHTLFVILGHTDERLWLEKAEQIRRRGGMTLLNTHPDYMLTDSRLAAYCRLLDRLRRDEQVWPALPGDVSAWWRRRAASQLVASDSGWRIVGPAAGEGRVVYAPADVPAGPARASVTQLVGLQSSFTKGDA